MSLRKTSCRACVASKRRCDLGSPSCSRCRKKSIACHYPYPPPQAKDDHSPIPEAHPESRVQNGLIESGSRELGPVCDWIEQSMIANQGDDFLDPTSLLGGAVTSCQAWDLLQGESGWLSLPSSADGFTSTLPRLERRVLEFWPRVHYTETWGFCIQTFLGYVDHFLDTGEMPFIAPLADRTSELPPVLREAYGVCAAYQTCKHAKEPFYHQLLKAGVNNMSLSTSTHSDLQDQLDRIQALVLYYIMLLAGGITHKPLLGELDRILAQGTADLERTELETRRATRDKGHLNPPFSESHLNHWLLCESARRLIMISYLVRAVHSVVRFQRCDFIKYLVGLPVSTKLYTEVCWEDLIYGREQSSAQSISGLLSYDEYVGHWERGGVFHVDEFGHLLLVACKGLGTVQERTSKEMILTFE
ncbi:hypothetical protein CNMCM5793_006665 [Aspergillus hiratsukae]|uniref:Zn(2)-C6 fungal-type domain-containing protein n=1 Tax=Aspergillus hiratsukae TaxID=1194566 RepID=A0A8H6PH86_9EURO|nr:hypothetical protein CNMCM5793_006665 [Aspergillus hiratsukae]KAF7171103.1 hypothetical protein CNMCM6106_005563 [Aspergillus hiratsukae]